MSSKPSTSDLITFNDILGPWKSEQTRYYRSRVGNYVYKVTSHMTKEDEANYGLTPLFPQMLDTIQASKPSVDVIKMVADVGSEVPVEVVKWERCPYKFPLFSIYQGEPLIPNPHRVSVSSDDEGSNTSVPVQPQRPAPRRRHMARSPMGDGTKPIKGAFEHVEPVTFRERIIAQLRRAKSFISGLWSRFKTWLSVPVKAQEHFAAIAELRMYPALPFLLDAELKANKNKLPRRLTVQEARNVKLSQQCSDTLYNLATKRINEMTDAEVYWNSGKVFPSFVRTFASRIYSTATLFAIVGVPLAVIMFFVSIFTLNPFSIALGAAVLFWVKSLVIGVSTGIVWAIYATIAAIAELRKPAVATDTDSETESNVGTFGPRIVEVIAE